jgi:hypothetical protein
MKYVYTVEFETEDDHPDTFTFLDGLMNDVGWWLSECFWDEDAGDTGVPFPAASIPTIWIHRPEDDEELVIARTVRPEPETVES